MTRTLFLVLMLGAVSACDDLPAAAPAAAPAAEEAAHVFRARGDDGQPLEVERPYDERADAERQLTQALAAARGNGKRVLVVFGANWCVWCRRLEHILKHHPEVSRALSDGFEVVHVDTGARRTGKNAAINERLGDPMRHGLPVVVVLDATGRVLTTQETGSLEDGDHHDPQRVLAFLRRTGA